MPPIIAGLNMGALQRPLNRGSLVGVPPRYWGGISIGGPNGFEFDGDTFVASDFTGVTLDVETINGVPIVDFHQVFVQVFDPGAQFMYIVLKREGESLYDGGGAGHYEVIRHDEDAQNQSDAFVIKQTTVADPTDIGIVLTGVGLPLRTVGESWEAEGGTVNFTRGVGYHKYATPVVALQIIAGGGVGPGGSTKVKTWGRKKGKK